MNTISPILIRSLAYPFYRSHAGIFFFVFFIMFGVVESSQVVSYHQSLIYGMLGSPIFMLVIFGVWLLYQLKVVLFFIRLLNQEEYQFLNVLALRSGAQNFLSFFILAFFTFLPVAIYSVAIYFIALGSGSYQQVLLILFFQLFLLSATALTLATTIQRKHVPALFSLPTLAFTFLRGLSGIYWNYLLHREKIAIALSKLFSLSLLYVVKETLVVGDDFRIVAITWLFATLSHTFLVVKLKAFEDHTLTWTRALPIHRVRIYFVYFGLYTLLFIPEVILLLGTLGKGVAIIHLPLLLLLSSSFLLSLHVYLYKTIRNPEYLVQFILALFIICFMLVLSKLIVLLTGCLLVLSLLYFHHYYYRYQPSITD